MRIILNWNENRCQLSARWRTTLGRVIVVNRFRVVEHEAAVFAEAAQLARATLATRPGHLDSRLGRNLDDPELWTLVTQWADVGSYRRALSAYEVKVSAVPLLGRALDEPSAYEELDADGNPETGALNRNVPR